jgi:hypothetical protein
MAITQRPDTVSKREGKEGKGSNDNDRRSPDKKRERRKELLTNAVGAIFLKSFTSPFS